MNCPNCSQQVEAGAVYCGNCGQALQARPSPVATAMPSYAVAVPSRQSGELKALVSLLLGITGIVGGLFMALFGLLLGIAGLVSGTMARRTYKRGLSMAGLIASSLAIVVGLGVWIYAIQHDPRLNPDASQVSHAPSTLPAVTADGLSTPCYTTGFVNQLNVSNNANSCDMNAYNGETLNTSTNAYKVYADKAQIETVNAFLPVAKSALEKDVANNLAGFEIKSERVATFAGSPAYVINASDKVHDVTVVEAAVLHKVGNGDNIFILVHATSGSTTDLDVLEAQWQWK